MTPTDAQLTAWLAGDLDPVADAEVSAAVESDPVVAARADALAGVMAGLAMAAADPPPAGFADALDAGLAAALGLPSPTPAPTPSAPGPAVVAPVTPPPPPAVSQRPTGRRDPSRPGGSRSSRRLQRLTSSLAVLLLVVTSGGLLVRTLRDGPDSVLPTDPDVVTADPDPSRSEGDATSGVPSPDPAPTTPITGDDGDQGDDVRPDEPTEDPAVDDDATQPTTGSTLEPADGSTDPSTGGTGGTTRPDDAADAPSPPVVAGGPTTGDGDEGTTTPTPAPTAPSSAEPSATEDGAASGSDPADGDAQPGDTDAAPPPPTEADDAAGEPAPQPEAAPAAPPTTHPTVADSRADLPTDDDVRAWFGGREETRQLLGLPEEEARDRAAEHRAVVEKSGSFASGAHPATCLDEALAGNGPAVVAAVESVVHDGQDALAYLVVRGTPELDRADVLVATPSGCAVLFDGPVTA
ncbi:hypothetical protein [Euzebya rosea]|uniref:hypothetical protein n=1 Tax=Euzebya rosea TaxID=2052804 RepID=UPI000D3E9181|nr:hypothetical protein [Euzebya rosea]